MNDLEESYRTLRLKLGKIEKDELEERVAKEESIEAQVIERNIRSDREHLTIVNLCANGFSLGSRINTQTGYVWVRVEPLYGTGVRNFDIALYSGDSKIMILVECKSGMSDVNRELNELDEKIRIAALNRDSLSDMVGDKLSYLEFALCLKAGLSPITKPPMLTKNIACCLWSADIFSSIIFLEKQRENSTTEISSGRLHREEKLRKLLLDGVRETSSTRIVTFLPSSHMCNVLEEIVPLLRLELDRSSDESGEFGLNDVQNIVNREISLQNFDEKEKRALAERMVNSAVEVGIFVDLSEEDDNLKSKKFKLQSQTRSTRQLARDCHEKYVRRKARESALHRILRDMTENQPSLEKYSDKPP